MYLGLSLAQYLTQTENHISALSNEIAEVFPLIRAET